MKENRTLSILQRIPVILAVTAASYGLPLQAQTQMQTASKSSLSRPAPSQRIAQDRRLTPRR